MEVSKKLFRKTVLHYRQLLHQEVYEQRNQALMKRLLNFLLDENKQCIHVFLPIERNKEPNLFALLPRLWEAGFKTVTSITNFDQKSMSHYILDADTHIAKNNLGIPEPTSGKKADHNLIEVILIPLVVVDLRGNRIGYGGGYYDRLLKGTKAIKVGLSLANPVERLSQTDNWDVPLDYLITPYKIYKNG